MSASADEFLKQWLAERGSTEAAGAAPLATAVDQGVVAEQSATTDAAQAVRAVFAALDRPATTPPVEYDVSSTPQPVTAHTPYALPSLEATAEVVPGPEPSEVQTPDQGEVQAPEPAVIPEPEPTPPSPPSPTPEPTPVPRPVPRPPRKPALQAPFPAARPISALATLTPLSASTEAILASLSAPPALPITTPISTPDPTPVQASAPTPAQQTFEAQIAEIAQVAEIEDGDARFDAWEEASTQDDTYLFEAPPTDGGPWRFILPAAGVATAAACWAALTTGTVIAIITTVFLAGLTALAWFAKTAIAASQTELIGHVLHVNRAGAVARVDLADPAIGVSFPSDLDSPTWQATFAFPDEPATVIDATMVDPFEFTRVLARHRPEAAAAL